MNKLFGTIRKENANPTNWQFSDIMIPGSKLPEYVNIKPLFPEVYTQQYNNCTTAAVLACDAYYYHSKPESGWIPSLTFTYYNQIRKIKPIEDRGSCAEVALDMVRKWGACSAKVWGNDKSFDEKPSDEAYANGLKGKELSKYYAVKNLKQVRNALANHYPVVMSMAWVFDYYDENFVMNDVTKKQADKCIHGHTVVIVGYDDRKKLVEFRNSWSAEWGNDGHAYIKYDTFNNVFWNDDSYAVVK